jgi:ATPase subunit of ABC transporter with duplicated ATPase domains
VLGIGGPNGAGKSTLLRAITGAARVFDGRIERSQGLSVTHHWQRPEQPPELPLLGREFLHLMGADTGRLPALVRKLLDLPLNSMSGGQYQLLQAWACLGGDSELVLLDEPTNNLDGDAILALSELLRRTRAPRAVLLVSHEIPFLNEHCQRMVEVGP